MGVKKGSKVALEYTAKFDDGRILFSNRGKEDPLTITVGKAKLVKGFEKGIIGMEEGETKKIEVKPEEGFGVKDPKKIKAFDKEELSARIPKLEKGIVLKFTKGNEKYRATVKEIKDDKIVLDFNHLLAGKTLHYNVTVKKIIKE